MINPLPHEIQSKLDNFTVKEAIARTAWGEADSEEYLGMWAVINTGQNRLNSGIKWWGHDLKSIFLHAGQTGIHQYSCWNSDNPRLQSILAVTEKNREYMEAMELADRCLANDLADITNNASHYFNKHLVQTPSWARGRTPCFELGNHVFYQVYD